jgi:hypothetical protein
MEGNIYLIQFTDQDWVDFRLAELYALLELHGIPFASPQLKQRPAGDSSGTVGFDDDDSATEHPLGFRLGA